MPHELTEAERFPLLSQSGRHLLHQMRQHPHAPLWNWPNGEQLNESGLERVRQFADRLSRLGDTLGLEEPPWLQDFTERCLNEVPYYRSRSRPGTRFVDLPTCSRADLAPRVWQFVPDSESLDELITFSSSGTTGQPTRTPHHPYSAACGIPLLEHALRSLCGIDFLRDSQRVSLAHLAAYPGAYTTAIVVAYLNEAGCIRINLDPSAWRCPDDSKKYMSVWQAPIWLGDPVAFGAIEKVALDHAPQAIISSIMHLNPAYALRLNQQYGCPVLDVYAMTEAGIIAVMDSGNTDATGSASKSQGHRVIAPDLFVEILDEAGNRCLPGQRGEITLSGGRNPFLPLLRYRTGDYAALELVEGQRVLRDLVGREPVEYISDSGRTVHSMEIVRLMRQFPVRQYQMLEVVDGYDLFVKGDVDHSELDSWLRKLLGQRFRKIRTFED